MQPFDPKLIEALRRLDYGRLLLLSPFDDTVGAFIALLHSAEQSIVTSIYGFTLPGVIDAIIAKHSAGASITLLLDHTQSTGPTEKAQLVRLDEAGVPYCVGTSPDSHQLLHAKITIVDGELVETGSWNYSASAAKQFNTFVLEKSPGAAKRLTDAITNVIQWIKENEPQYQVHERKDHA